MFQLLEKINARWWQAAFWLAWLSATTLMVLPVSQLPEVNIWDKAEHAGTFAVLTSLAWLGYRRHCSVVTVAGLLVFYGIGIECVQHFVPSRSFSVLDMVADAIGVLPVLFGVMWLEKTMWLEKKA